MDKHQSSLFLVSHRDGTLQHVPHSCTAYIRKQRTALKAFCFGGQHVFAFLPTGFGERLAKHGSDVHRVSPCAVFASLVQQVPGKTGRKKSGWFAGITFQVFFEWTSPFLSMVSTQMWDVH